MVRLEPSRSERFRPRERLRRQADFARVLELRCSAADNVLMVLVAPNGRAWSRLGIRTSRRLGQAVRRSYIRRRIREAFRRSKDQIPVGLDILCLARRGAADREVDVVVSFYRLVRRAERALRRHTQDGA
ncbi:MAG TPA: ribonuclease P protein component [Phycisphaerae bacterium]|nr:ribonuclease P protein component [Phycisphaerae bacterium]HNU44020.1 ribonuclease P protein component [Phycisphaerae bacterium]